MQLLLLQGQFPVDKCIDSFEAEHLFWPIWKRRNSQPVSQEMWNRVKVADFSGLISAYAALLDFVALIAVRFASIFFWVRSSNCASSRSITLNKRKICFQSNKDKPNEHLLGWLVVLLQVDSRRKSLRPPWIQRCLSIFAFKPAPRCEGTHLTLHQTQQF